MDSMINSGKNIIFRLVIQLLALSLSCFSMQVIAGPFANAFDSTTQSPPHEFTHFETGFPLTGAHVIAECVTCHVGGIMKGTPRNCSGCHAKGMRIVATTMSNKHIVTNDPCESCHTNTATFLGARFNHSGVLPGSCATQCHNGILSKGKPSSHTTVLKATSTCDTCHRVSAWFPTFYNHSSVVPGTCASRCHDGVTATGKTGRHTGMKATLACDQCHNTIGWFPARYNHAAVFPGSCSTCHNGASAAGKPFSHTGAKVLLPCDSCHNVAAWLPAGYNHIGVAPGTCLTCHAAQRPTSHIARGYTASCDACHSMSSKWTFNHALQQGKHTCNSCHSRRDHHGSGSQPCDNCHSVNGWGG